MEKQNGACSARMHARVFAHTGARRIRASPERSSSAACLGGDLFGSACYLRFLLVLLVCCVTWASSCGKGAARGLSLQTNAKHVRVMPPSKNKALGTN
eukprot:7372029-Lingulodinium_polyedra.AAC.1